MLRDGPFSAESPRLLAIVADDLTGAMDASSPFAAIGLSTSVQLAPDGAAVPEAAQVLGVTTESRSGDSREAQRATQAAVQNLASTGFARLIKKVDSTLRGHLGVEVVAAREAAGAPIALLAPAFPATGRTLERGILQVEGSAAHLSAVDLVERQTGEPVGLVSLPDVDHGDAIIAGGIDALLDEGRRVIVLDATEDHHLDAIARVARRSYRSALLAGSGGLTSAVARDLGVAKRARPAPPPRQERILIVAGSVNRVTLEQLDRLPGATTVWADADAAVAEVHREALRVREATEAALRSGPVVVLRWANPAAVVLSGATAQPSADRVAKLTTFLELAVGNVFAGRAPGLVLTGGETAAAVLRAAGPNGIDVGGELASGVPWGSVRGGSADGALVVTKAGGFGGPQTLSNIVRWLMK